MNIKKTNAWNALKVESERQQDFGIIDYFKVEKNRFQRMSCEFDGVFLDLSKQKISVESMGQLVCLAREVALDSKIENLFNGAHVNATETRPALHTALRAPKNETLVVDGEDIVPKIHQALEEMEKIVELIHAGQWRGYSGESIDTIVNIGVGGSILGPELACKALEEYSCLAYKKLKIKFVSCMDGSEVSSLLPSLDPEKTLFVITSKSFTTIDTMANASTVRSWLKNISNMPDEIVLSRHFIGISSCPGKMSEWGIPESNQLKLWNWVGGRYSLWSTVGLPIAIKIGMDSFRELLNGAHHADIHFRSCRFEKNIPVLMALIGVWNTNFLNINSHAILPYDGRLEKFPAYIGQLEMESNGKSVTLSGEQVAHKTCPIIWGGVGTNAQHAFYQLLHQGTESVMCDFIASKRRGGSYLNESLEQQHALNLSNCLGQSRVLAFGSSNLSSDYESIAYRRHNGNQPSSTIILEALSPSSLGKLLAIYEHKVFVQSAIWSINAFDQWGVELGKLISNDMLEVICNSDRSQQMDESTSGLIEHILQ